MEKERPTSQSKGFSHHPVLLREAVQYLVVRRGGGYIDCTVGEGGHSAAILQACLPGGRLLGIDLDSRSLERARQRLEWVSDPQRPGPLQGHEASFTLVQGNYARLEEFARTLGYSEPDGILLDLGLSSLQLEGEGRGFSLQRDDPLDMRFNPETASSSGAKQTLTAADVVNDYPFDDLARVISAYGEEPRARSIARAIIRQRPLRTTLELADLVARVGGGRRAGHGRGRRGSRIHPATRTFQALRIEVNSELDNLRAGLEQAISILKPGGRLVVISYHSLEDRIVKEAFSREAKGCVCPPRVPVCICGHTPTLKVITRRIVRPLPEEVKVNPRSRSACMRVSERLAYATEQPEGAEIG